MDSSTMITLQAADARGPWRHAGSGAGLQQESRLSSAEDTRGSFDVREALPCDPQTPEFVTAWMRRHGVTGTVVVVRHAQLGLYEYLLDEVRRTDTRLSRIYLADHGVFRLNGDYLAPPRGRFTLLAPVGEVLEAAIAGHTWMNGKPAYRRPHAARERALIDLARLQNEARE